MNFIITDVKNVYSHYYQYPENQDMFDGRLPFADYLTNGNDKAIIVLIHNKIIAFCLLEEQHRGYWVKQAVSVDSNYREQGIAKKMLIIAHQFVIQNNAKMLHGNYSIEGHKYLHKINMQFGDTYARI